MMVLDANGGYVNLRYVERLSVAYDPLREVWALNAQVHGNVVELDAFISDEAAQARMRQYAIRSAS